MTVNINLQLQIHSPLTDAIDCKICVCLFLNFLDNEALCSRNETNSAVPLMTQKPNWLKKQIWFSVGLSYWMWFPKPERSCRCLTMFQWLYHSWFFKLHYREKYTLRLFRDISNKSQLLIKFIWKWDLFSGIATNQKHVDFFSNVLCTYFKWAPKNDF